jgi:hypothetical protein
MVFVGVLVGAAAVAILGSAPQGVEADLLHALVAVVTLQVGYAAGLVLRAAIRSLHKRSAPGPASARSAR